MGTTDELLKVLVTPGTTPTGYGLAYNLSKGVIMALSRCCGETMTITSHLSSRGTDCDECGLNLNNEEVLLNANLGYRFDVGCRPHILIMNVDWARKVTGLETLEIVVEHG